LVPLPDNELAIFLKELGVAEGSPEYDQLSITLRFSLYQCAYCGNPSAGLRKCSGCGIKRYALDSDSITF
jgi:hypothetical protein